jgi:hypothetical protein
MLQGSIITSLALVALALFGWALLITWRRGWFLAWLKGMWVIALLSGSAAILFTLLDFISYKNLNAEQPIATISLYQKSEQLFDVTLIDEEGLEVRFDVAGDQWQLDARILSWQGPVAALGAKPVYRLDRLSGRYTSLEQARNSKPSVHGLYESGYVDSWQVFRYVSGWLDADYGSAVYMPMADGAVYSVYLTAKGMLVRPLNDVAKEAMGSDQW